MWTLLLGLVLFGVGIFVLLALLSPKGDERPKLFTCQRCTTAFGHPPLHPLPERYQEDELQLCEPCAAELEERIREVVRRTQAEFMRTAAPSPPSGG